MRLNPNRNLSATHRLLHPVPKRLAPLEPLRRPRRRILLLLPLVLLAGAARRGQLR